MKCKIFLKVKISIVKKIKMSKIKLGDSMQRDYMRYVGSALKDGMTPQEMQNLFSEIESKSNTKQGARILRLFAKGVGKAKQKSLIQQYEQSVMENQAQMTQEKSYQYIYK
jgi:hypothetical protein